jgi:hypothetical protein
MRHWQQQSNFVHDVQEIFFLFFNDLFLPSQDGHLATWQNQNICVR